MGGRQIKTMTKNKRQASTGDNGGKRKKNDATDTENTAPPYYKLVAIISPAKTLKTATAAPAAPAGGGGGLTEDEKLIPQEEWTVPQCISTKQHQQVVKSMKGHAKEGNTKLSKLLGVSTNIAQTAHSYWTSFNIEGGNSNREYVAKPCGYSFDGVVYQGLDMISLIKAGNDDNDNDTSSSSPLPSSFPAISYLQEHLRIVDPVYGWLRPMDVIQPYRLEMASKNVLSDQEKSTKLANFWKPAIRDCLEKEETNLPTGRRKNLIVLNLASDEYSSAVDWPPHKVIKVVFRHGGRVLAVHAKRARGLMARYLAMNQVQSLEDVKNFNLESYQFQPDESTMDVKAAIGMEGNVAVCLVFDRPADWKTKVASKKKGNK